MRTRNRFIALAAGVVAVLALFGGAASAGPPVKVEGCELIVEIPTTGKSVAIPICQNGPPIQ